MVKANPPAAPAAVNAQSVFVFDKGKKFQCFFDANVDLALFKNPKEILRFARKVVDCAEGRVIRSR